MVSPAPVMFFASPFSERLPLPTQSKIKASVIYVFVTLDCHTNSMSGVHEFSWAVLPHAGHFLQSDVPQAAYLFNSPLHCM